MGKDPEEGAHRNISNQAVRLPGSGGETVASFWSPLPLTLVVQGRCYSRGRQHGLVSFALVWGKPSSCTVSMGDCMLCDLYSNKAVLCFKKSKCQLGSDVLPFSVLGDRVLLSIVPGPPDHSEPAKAFPGREGPFCSGSSSTDAAREY